MNVLTGHSNTVINCVFSPDGKTLATVSYDDTVRLWNVHKDKENNPFAKIKRRLLKGGGKRKKPTVLTGHTLVITSCVFSPDGRTLATSSQDKTLRLWDTRRGKKIAVLTSHTNNNIFSGVNNCAFSPDGHILASASRDNTVRLWDTRTWEEITVLNGHTKSVNACLFSPNGRILASASNDNTVRLWDVHTRKEIFKLTGHTGFVIDCAFSPDGQTLISTSLDNTIRLWNTQSGEPLVSFPCLGRINCVDYNALGTKLAAGDQSATVYLLEIKGRKIKPIYMTAHLHKKRWEKKLIIRCPACQQSHPISQGQLGSEITCPTPSCGLRLKINPFTIEIK